jgi:hypothetical protein
VFSFHRLEGDADGNMVVDTADMDLINAALGALSSSATWNANADLDRDNRITVRDRVIVARANGHAILPPAPIPIVALPNLPGDFNADDVVDAADYVMWRKNIGQTPSSAFLTGDNDNDGAADVADHAVWRQNFGRNLDDVGAHHGNHPVSVAFAEMSATAVELPLIAVPATAANLSSYFGEGPGVESRELRAFAPAEAIVRDDVFTALADSVGRPEDRFRHHPSIRRPTIWLSARLSDQAALARSLHTASIVDHIAEHRRNSSRFPKLGPDDDRLFEDSIDEVLGTMDTLELAVAASGGCSLGRLGTVNSIQ